jgi:hypothetical protein
MKVLVARTQQRVRKLRNKLWRFSARKAQHCLWLLASWFIKSDLSSKTDNHQDKLI